MHLNNKIDNHPVKIGGNRQEKHESARDGMVFTN
jgi:hypothetical protein